MDRIIRVKDSEILYLSEWKFWTFVLLLSALIYSYPFYSIEYLNHGDAFFHMNRIEGIKESLLGGQFPVRVHGFQLNGYGTIDGIMYPDLFLYFPAILRILGLSITLTWNVFWIFLIVLGFFTSFVGFAIWSQNIRAGALGAFLFNITEAGFFCLGHAVGDHIAIFAIPLAIGSLLKLLEDEKFAKYWIMFVIGFFMIFQSHILTTIIILPLIFIILLLKLKSLKNHIQRAAVFKCAMFSVLLNIWFAVPFLYFYKTTVLHIYDSKPLSLHNSTLDFTELLLSQFYLGIPFLTLLILFLILKKSRQNKGFIISVLVYCFLMFTMHIDFPWEWIENNMPGGQFFPKFQFSFRFIPFGIVFLSFYMSLLSLEYLKNKTKYLTALLFFSANIAAIIMHPYVPIYFLHDVLVIKTEHRVLENLPSHRTDDIYLQEDYLYSDVVFYKLRNDKNEFYDSNDYKTDAEIFDIKKQGASLSFSYVAKENTTAQVPLFYWEGYEAKDEFGNDLEINFGQNRFMEVKIPKGEHRVKIDYAGLKIFRFFDIVSLISLMIFCGICVKKIKKDANGNT